MSQSNDDILTTSSLTLTEKSHALSRLLEVYAQLSQTFFEFNADDAFTSEQALQQLAQACILVCAYTFISQTFRHWHWIAKPDTGCQRFLTRERFAAHRCSARPNAQAVNTHIRREQRADKLTTVKFVHRDRRSL